MISAGVPDTLFCPIWRETLELHQGAAAECHQVCREQADPGHSLQFCCQGLQQAGKEQILSGRRKFNTT